MVLRRLLVPLLLSSLSLAPCLAQAQDQPAESWATSGARTLLEQGDAEAQAGRVDQAARRYLEALSLDPTYGPAYLALGALREKEGDVREADRVYTAGLERVVGFWQAGVARAKLRRRLGQREAAHDDLLAAAVARGNSPALLEELAEWDIEDARFVEALLLYRRVRRQLEDNSGEPQALTRVKLRIRALGVLAGEQDVLRASHPHADPARRAIEAIARRAGL